MASSLPPPSAQGPPPEAKPSKPKSSDESPSTTSSSAFRPKLSASIKLPSNMNTSSFRAPEPTRRIFDPWNACTTGHQRAENRLAGSTSWRSSRTRKLAAQFRAGFASGGGEVQYDTVGAGSKDFEHKRLVNGSWDDMILSGAWKKNGVAEHRGDIGGWVIRGEGKTRKGPEGKRRVKRMKLDNTDNGGSGGDEDAEEAICVADREKWKKRWEKRSPPPSAQVPTTTISKDKISFGTSMTATTAIRKHKTFLQPTSPATSNSAILTLKDTPPSAQPMRQTSPSSANSRTHDALTKPLHPAATSPSSPIASLLRLAPSTLFCHLTFFILGSTYPFLSDHMLKLLLATHGGCIELGLARRKVTHVIVGYGVAGGAALAAGKAQREFATKGGRKEGVRFVKVDWVLECLKKGRRVAEAGFAVEIGAGPGLGPMLEPVV